MSTALGAVDQAGGAQATERTPFDPCATLPQGTTVLEASAGTGKTHTIATLTSRYVAEGHAELGELMLATFGRTASNELRLRVRERLVSLAAALAETRQGRRPAYLDPVEALLCTAHADELARREARIGRALADFDAATIATTHEFCLRMLDGLGVLADREPDAHLVEQVTDLTREVATDAYLARYAGSPAPPLKYAEALTLAEQAVSSVHARLVPTDAEPGSPAKQRVDFARAVRAEVERRKRAGRLFSYDDMLTRLRDALAHPRHGEAAAERLRRRYKVVLVDEFQDTDPIQWEILRRAFHGRSTLILIGDPKQAIYAFRGADVYSYLEAVAEADRVQTLTVNWRTDQPLVDALDALMGGTALGEDGIVVRPVVAHHTDSRVRDPDGAVDLQPPLRVRVLPGGDRDQLPAVRGLRDRIAADLVAEVTGLLGRGLQLDTPGGRRRLEPADLAVLVRTNRRGEAIRERLVAAGVPAVMLGAASVYASEVAEDWLTLLVALDAPRQQAVRQVSLTCFVGWTFARLAQAPEEELVQLSLRVRGWSRVLAAHGVAALLEAVTAEAQLTERLLGTRAGERTLTDLRHLGQSLHAAMTAGRLGTGALVEWLRARIAEARGNLSSEGTRRLETDDKAVTVLTLHRSKGLEFPVVYLPDAWDRWVSTTDDDQVLRVHGTGADRVGDCLLDVGGRRGPGRAGRLSRHRFEEGGEDLRLLYVGLTRAACRLVTWWAPSRNTEASALQRLLYHRADQAAGVPRAGFALRGDPFALDLPEPIAREAVEPRPATAWRTVPEGGPALAVRRFDRALDLDWRRTSYSGLTAAVHGQPGPTVPAVGSEPEAAREDDEQGALPAGLPQPGGDGGTGLDRLSPMHALPTGAQFGTAVHAALELVDPAAPDLPAELLQACRLGLAQGPPGPLTADELATSLLPSYRTPLGPLAADLTLADFGVPDRLAELTFEYPLGTVGPSRLAALPALLRRHLPAGDLLAGYADRLADPGLTGQSLRGFLNGSIDAVLRHHTADGPRYLVVDYKTNWLGDGEPLTLRHYTPTRMAEAMMAAHYPLQALLYAVAVHRLLRWRQPGYDPAVHLGGVLYLFLRGMAGPDTPRVDGVPCGVFSWRPPAPLVVEWSDTLAGLVAP